MSRFLNTAATMQQLSINGMEEASREGRREADLEHLLLALVISDQRAGTALRGVGITLDAARQAVRDQHREQLSQLGVEVEQDGPDRIVFHETDGYEWTDRARAILSSSTEDDGRGDASSVLRRLLDEPSGLIAEILARLGTTADAVREALNDAEHTAASAPLPSPRRRNWVHGRFESFVPAPIEDVWELLADAERMPEWNPMTGSIEADAEHQGSWIAHAPSRRPDGTPLKIKPEYRRRRLTQAEALRPTRVVWWSEHSDAPDVPPRMLAIVLTPTEAGTHATLTSTWRRRTGWRRLLGLPLRPLQRYFVWLDLSHTGGAITRAFR